MHRTNGRFLTPRELTQTIEEFKQEQEIWNQLQIGQVLIMESGNGWDFDYFAHQIVSIDSENRKITYNDLSQKDKPTVTLGRLHTITELATRPYLKVNIDTTGYTATQIGTV